MKNSALETIWSILWIPAKYQGCTFENYRVNPLNQEGYELARKFSTSSRGLFLWGPCGCGKTHLATAAMKARLMLTKRPVTFVAFEELVSKLRGASPEVREESIHFYAQKAMLLDDVVVQDVTDFVRQLLYQLVDRKYREMQWDGLIMTSNQNMAQFSATYGDRTASRVAEMCDIAKVSGDDQRVTR